MMDLTVLKAEARKAAFAARKEAFARGQGQAAEILADFLSSQRGRPLAGYMPMRTEIDPLPAMAAHQGPVGVPVILGAGGVERLVEIQMDDAEQAMFQKSVDAVRGLVAACKGIDPSLA